MRGTHEELDVVRRAVVHALELAEEDVAGWCDGLTDAEMFAQPGGVAPVAFHLLHIARSLDRLLTYAEDRWLDDDQLAALQTEMDAGSAAEVLAEFREGLRSAKERVREIQPKRLEDSRGIGRKRLPTTVGGLLIHCAEHTARHVGQVVTTVKFVRAAGFRTA
jgi:uncharacterized damage-inducible protein DinB